MKAFLFIFLLLVVSCSAKKEHQTDRALMELRGFVRSVKTTYYHAIEKDGKVVRGPMNEGIAYTVAFFNRKGMLTQTDYFYSSRRKDEAQTEKRMRTFDTAGERLLRDSLWSSYPDIFDGVYVFTYDSDEQLTDRSFFSKTGKCTSKEQYRYDSNGNRILRKVYLSGKLSATTSSEYDGNGNEIRATTTYHGGSMTDKLVQEFQYDRQNRNVAYIVPQSGENRKTLYRYGYNERGDFSSSEEIRNGSTTHLQEYRYTYDARGNWIKRTEIVSNRAVQLIEREIVYY